METSMYKMIYGAVIEKDNIVMCYNITDRLPQKIDIYSKDGIIKTIKDFPQELTISNKWLCLGKDGEAIILDTITTEIDVLGKGITKVVNPGAVQNELHNKAMLIVLLRNKGGYKVYGAGASAIVLDSNYKKLVIIDNWTGVTFGPIAIWDKFSRDKTLLRLNHQILGNNNEYIDEAVTRIRYNEKKGTYKIKEYKLSITKRQEN